MIAHRGKDSPRVSLTPIIDQTDEDIPASVHTKYSKANLFCVTNNSDNENNIDETAMALEQKEPVERKHSICWDEETKTTRASNFTSVYYDNKAYVGNIDPDNPLTEQPFSDLQEASKAQPMHIFVTSGSQLQNGGKCEKDISASGVKVCTLSEIDIHRLATPTPGSSRERSDSLKTWLKDQSMSSSATLSTVVDEISNTSVVCMNAAGPLNLEDVGKNQSDAEKPSTSKQGPVRMDSTMSGSSSVFSEGRGCRICWNNEEKEPFIQPCLCSGSSANVHLSCLKKWLQVTNQFKCEVCNNEYRSSSAFKPFSKWSWKCSKTRYLSQLEATMILLGIVTPPLICGIVLCSQKIVEYVSYPEHAWKTAGSFAALMTLVIASSLTYLTALIYFCRKFGAVCRQWIQTNQRTIVHLGQVETVIEQTPEMQQSRDNDLVDVDMYHSVWSIT